MSHRSTLAPFLDQCPEVASTKNVELMNIRNSLLKNSNRTNGTNFSAFGAILLYKSFRMFPIEHRKYDCKNRHNILSQIQNGDL